MSFLAGVFVALAAILGGASYPNLLVHHYLQLTALVLLASAILRRGLQPLSRQQWLLIVLLLGYVVWSAAQLIPLPDHLWEKLPGRETISNGADLLGTGTDQLSISMVPERTLSAILGCLPPLAIFVYICRHGWQSSIPRLVWIIPILGAISTGVGVAQLLAGPDSSLYVYAFANRQLPVGLFSNANHQATFCLIGLTFVFALVARLQRSFTGGDQDLARAISLAVLGFANIVGVLLAGSLAGHIMLVLVMLISIASLTSVKSKSGTRNVAVAGAIALVAISAAVVGFGTVFDSVLEISLQSSELSRQAIWQRSGTLIDDHFMVGSGLGTFRHVYQLYEDPSLVGFKYVNNAHNDYLQVVIESGLIGLVAIVAGLILWAISTQAAWRAPTNGETTIKRAASLALLVVILHSIVDYPLRTPALATLSAVCLAILVTPRHPSARHQTTNSAQEKRISL